MAMTIENLISTLDQLNVKHIPDPGNDAAVIFYATPKGPVTVFLRLETEGRYLHFSSPFESACPANPGVLSVMAKLNYDHRFVKFGRDDDNHALADAGIWVESDGRLTPKQLERSLDNFVGSTSHGFDEMRSALRGGIRLTPAA